MFKELRSSEYSNVGENEENERKWGRGDLKEEKEKSQERKESKSKGRRRMRSMHKGRRRKTREKATLEEIFRGKKKIEAARTSQKGNLEVNPYKNEGKKHMYDGNMEREDYLDYDFTRSQAFLNNIYSNYSQFGKSFG